MVSTRYLTLIPFSDRVGFGLVLIGGGYSQRSFLQAPRIRDPCILRRGRLREGDFLNT